MEYLNLLCNITFKKNLIQIESPYFVSIVNSAFGKEYPANEEYTYGGWEIFLDPFRSFAKEIDKEIHLPNGHWFNNVLRLYRYHVLPGLKQRWEERPFNKRAYPHTFIFALPYFVNDEGQLEIPAAPTLRNNFSETSYRKEMKFNLQALMEKEKKEYWQHKSGIA